jgi:CheY-like chemotaxis protein
VVSSLLRKCNYKVTVAQSGSEAMEVLQSSGPGTFQLVLTDLVMPTYSGLDLLRFVRSHQGLKNLPVVSESTHLKSSSRTCFDELPHMHAHSVLRRRVTGAKAGGPKASLITTPTPTIHAVMSSSQQHETVCECISNGAEDFLVKPVTRKEVQNIWTHVVKRLRSPGISEDIRMEVRQAGRGGERGEEKDAELGKGEG